MKIVDVCEFYSPRGGGVRTYVHNKLTAGPRMGHEIVVIAPADRNDVIEWPGGGRIHLVKAPVLPFDERYHMFWDAAAVHALLDAERPDVLEASSPWRGAWIAASWRGTALRSLFMHHDPLSAWAYRWLDGIASRDRIDRHFAWFWRYLRRMCAHYSVVICAAPSLTRRLTAGGINNAVTVPLGIDPGIFSPHLRCESLRAELLDRCGLGTDAALLLGIGRHTAEKRWLTVVDAFRAVASRRPVGLVLIGDGHDSRKLVAHVAGDPHIHLLAPIRNRNLLARVMASADALVHGSAAETFGLVASEALASGLPLILPDQGAVSDIADPAYSETYRTGDARDAARAIERLLNRDPVQLRAATTAAAARIWTIDAHLRVLFDNYASQPVHQWRAA